MATQEKISGFHVMCTGQIESVQYDGIDNIYCRYSITYGSDWRVHQGVDAGLTQIAYKAHGSDEMTLNFPLDMSFTSTNPHGWPRIVISVRNIQEIFTHIYYTNDVTQAYGVDVLGRDVVRGYGSVHLPTRAGKYVRNVPLFAPVSSSWMQQFLAWITGSPPEFLDSKIVSQNEGREVTRVRSAGVVKLQINIATHGMMRHGYSESRVNRCINLSSESTQDIEGQEQTKMTHQKLGI